MSCGAESRPARKGKAALDRQSSTRQGASSSGAALSRSKLTAALGVAAVGATSGAGLTQATGSPATDPVGFIDNAAVGTWLLAAFVNGFN